MDSELCGRKPEERPHGEVVGAAVVDGKLFCEVLQGIKAVAGIKAYLIFSVAAFYLAIVSGRIGPNQFVADAKFCSRCFKESRKIPFTVGKTIGKLKAVVGLDTFYPNAPACIPLRQLFQKISRGIGGLFRISGEKPQTCKLIDSGILEQAKLRVSNTAAGDHFHSNLNPFSGIGHLLIRLGFAGGFGFRLREHTEFAHDPE